MRLYKSALLGGVAALALGGFTVGTTSTADAFDNMNWKWDLDIDTNITERVRIDIDIDPIGKILDEVVQYQIGDVTATSDIHDIYNWKPYEEVTYKVGAKNDYKLSVDGGYDLSYSGRHAVEGSESFSTSVTKAFEADLDGSLETSGTDTPPFFIGGIGAIGGFFTSPGPDGAAGAGVLGAIGAYATNGEAEFDAELNGSLTNSYSQETDYSSSFQYDGRHIGEFKGHLNVSESFITTVYDIQPAVQNALNELPLVTSTASAIGNLISVEGDVPVQETSLQVVFNDVDRRTVEGGPRVNFEDADFDLDADLSLQDSEFDLDSKNYKHDVALLLGLAAGAGLIDQAEISAESKLYNIYNAQVDSSATAIGNLKTISVDSRIDQNGLVLADITQLSVANVSANAYAKDVHVVNYTNLGKLSEPLAKATATAIGNAVNISVNSGQGPR